MESFWRDLRLGLRSLRRAPAFALIAILTLGIGIGADTALFSVVNGVLLSPLPFPQPQQLMDVRPYSPSDGQVGASYPNFLDWERMNHTFSALAAFRGEDYNLGGTLQPERLRGLMVSASFFPAFGIRPVVGRAFDRGDDHPGAGRVALISTALWQRKFGGARNILNRSIDLNGAAYTIVGVVPAGFHVFGDPPDLWVPLGQWDDPTFRSRDVSMGTDCVGRLRPGVTAAQASADLAVVARVLAQAYPASNQNTSLEVQPLKNRIVGAARPLLLILLAAVGFVLLIACANVANLLLVRTTLRAREFAIRAALGAGRGRLLCQLLGESLLLAAGGAIFGWLLAVCGTQAALRDLPAALPRTDQVALDGRVLGFTVLLSVGTALIFGLLPAFRAASPRLVEHLKEGGRGATSAHHRIQSAMVALQMALAFVLLIGAGLMIRSLASLWRANPGFDTSHLLTFSLSMPPGLAANPTALRGVLDAIDRRLEAVPDVAAASLNDGSVPLTGDESDLPFWPAGQPMPASQTQMDDALFYLVQPGYLSAMRIPLRRGRFITPADTFAAPAVVVVDDTFAAKFFPHQDPIGQRIHLAIINVQPVIVGIVGHVKHFGLDESARTTMAEMYLPIDQLPDAQMPLLDRGASAVVRTRGAPDMALAAIRDQLRGFDASEVVYDVKSMDAILADSLANRRFTLILLALFASLALFLAAVGVYGVISYLTARRTQEIGVRMALGARPGAILALVLRQGMRMALAGVAAGLAIALLLSRVMASLLFDIGARDPWTFAVVAALLTLSALLACLAPSLRATRVDPTVALRCE